MVHGFMGESDFTRMLVQHRLVGSLDKTLEIFEREGWLQPAFRHNREIPPNGHSSLPHNLQQFYRHGRIEFPQAGDYKPWNSFKPKLYEPGEKCTDIYYHKYQLLQVWNILEHKTVHTLCRNPKNISDQVISSIITTTSFNMGSFETSYNEITKIVGMLMLLEEHYVSPSSIPLGLNLDQANNLLREMWDNFSAKNMLKDTKFLADDVHRIRDRFIADAKTLDPLSDWYDLVRIMKWSHVAKLTGTACTAQLYYTIAQILTMFINDLEGISTDTPYVPFGNDYTEWRKRVYKVSTLDYNEQKTRKAIIEYYTQGATTRLYLLVEGDSEGLVQKLV